MTRDFPVMLIFTVALFAMAYGFRDGNRLTRFEGGLLLGGFAGYMATLVLTAA
jgi:cation:H+ antiporter